LYATTLLDQLFRERAAEKKQEENDTESLKALRKIVREELQPIVQRLAAIEERLDQRR
jgi:hypothetical protein